MASHQSWTAAQIPQPRPGSCRHPRPHGGAHVVLGVRDPENAATAPDVEGGQFIGPDGAAEVRGGPTRVRLVPAAADRETGRRLWELSEGLTDVRFAFAAPA